MRITIFILSNEIYQKFLGWQSAIEWLNRTSKYLNQRIIIVQKGNTAKVWERVEDLRQLQKEIIEFANQS